MIFPLTLKSFKEGQVMKSIRILFPLMVVTACICGCIFDSDNDKKSDTAKKGSVSGTVKMVVTGEAVPGINVYLVNLKASIDKTDGADNRKAFVDSAVTDSGGKYVLNNIAPGEYAVFPMKSDSTAMYKFASVAGSDSSRFSMNGDSLTVDYTVEKTDAPGISVYQNATYIYFKNGSFVDSYVYRRNWVIFVPFYVATPYYLNDTEKNSIYLYDNPAYTLCLYTLDNEWKFNAEYNDLNGVRRKTEFHVYYSFDTPQGSKIVYNYDFSTSTLTFVSSEQKYGK